MLPLSSFLASLSECYSLQLCPGAVCFFRQLCEHAQSSGPANTWEPSGPKGGVGGVPRLHVDGSRAPSARPSARHPLKKTVFRETSLFIFSTNLSFF